jgi:hypothetical protein
VHHLAKFPAVHMLPTSELVSTTSNYTPCRPKRQHFDTEINPKSFNLKAPKTPILHKTQTFTPTQVHNLKTHNNYVREMLKRRLSSPLVTLFFLKKLVFIKKLSLMWHQSRLFNKNQFFYYKRVIRGGWKDDV